MNRIFFFLILPCLLFAGEHNVPLGTQSNQFIYTITNSRNRPLENMEVIVHSAPEWMHFQQECIFLETIPSMGRGEVCFQFDVSEGQSNQTGDVTLIVRKINCQCAIATHTISFRTILNLADSDLLEPYPNPSNSSATIPFALKEDAQVTMIVYNILGQRVQTCLDEKRSAGRWSILWDGKDEYGRMVSSGVYVIHFQTRMDGKERTWNKKLLLAK